MYDSDYNQHAGFRCSVSFTSSNHHHSLLRLFSRCSFTGNTLMALAVCYYCSLGANALLLPKQQPPEPTTTDRVNTTFLNNSSPKVEPQDLCSCSFDVGGGCCSTQRESQKCRARRMMVAPSQ